MTTQAICKDCGHDIVLSEDKAVATGEYQTVWSDDSGWVCDGTGDEHEPLADFTGVPGYERDPWGNAICGHDFMAGTICSDARGHAGAHSAKCLKCGGDGYAETCSCDLPYEEEETPMDPVEALTYAILAINTDQEPTATSGNDLLYLELNAERALTALDALRAWVIAQGEDFAPGKD